MRRAPPTTVDERASSITGVVMAGAAIVALATLAVVEETGGPQRKRSPNHQTAAAKPDRPKRAARPRWEEIERAVRTPPARPPADWPPSPRKRPGRAGLFSSPGHPLGRDLARITNLSRRKTAFITAVLPIVRDENARVMEERRLAETRPPLWLYRRYNVTPGDRRTLLRRIDVVPASLAIAQAAIESGWGTSRFVREANNLFGERTYKRAAKGVPPRDANGFKITSFRSVAASVRSYMHNLNSNAAYRDFRRARAAEPRAGGIALARHLTPYSELRGAYVATIRQVIEENDLDRLDFARLANR